MNNRLFYYNFTIFLQDSSRKVCRMHNFIKLTYMGLCLNNVYNVCNKNMRIYKYKQIWFSVIVSVDNKSANINLQGMNVMFVLFTFKGEMFALCTPGRNGVTAI